MYIRLKKGIKAYIIKLLNTYECIEVFSGMALGFDTILALAVLELKQDGYNIRLHCAIPCANHTAKWRKESVDMWNMIVALADEVTYVSDKPYTASCMQDRNKYMVDNCDELLVLWNGTLGGTANCVKYAQSKGVKITRLYKAD